MMKHITYFLAFMLTITAQQLIGQTAKSKRDRSINDARAKTHAEKFGASSVRSEKEREIRHEKNRIKIRAIRFCIENSDLKEKRKQKLKEALDKGSFSSQLGEFIATHKKEIEAFVVEMSS